MSALKLENRSVLKVSGPESETFLQGLITNDIKKADAGQGIYAALLTPQGKYLFDFFILRQDGAFLFDVEGARKAELVQKLTFYKLRAAVEIEDLSGTMDVWVFFPGPSKPSGCLESNGCFVYPDPRLAALGWRGFLQASQEPEQTGAFSDYEGLRLRLGVPDSSKDIEVDKRFILEANFRELHGVDFKKGCYVGQEMTARMTYRGSLKKRLLPANIKGSLPAPGTPFYLDGKEAGHVLSGRGDRAMALMRLEFLSKGPFKTQGGATVDVYVPEWLQTD